MSIKTEMELSLQDEYTGVNFGDRRLSRRLVSMINSIEKNPGASMPTIFPGSAELEGCYRFFQNDKVTPEAMLETHMARTAERTRACETVIVAHDTTEFNLGKKPRKDLGQVGRGKSYGCYGHFSLAIANGKHRLALGVSAVQTYRRDGKLAKKGRKPLHSERHSDDTNEGLRWLRGVEASEKVLKGCQNTIHVMDREADDFALLAAMLKQKYRFVIRSSYDRRTIDKELKLSDVLRDAPLWTGRREICVSSRDVSPLPGQRKRHPPRRKRMAQLAVRNVSVAVPRPKSAPRSCPKEIVATLVQVTEISPPKGEEPISWNLWTTEPCDTEEQVWAVVDAYRARWVVEEYFKAIKTGCAYESRQFETEAALLRVLALFIPMAWWLLMLRSLNRIDPDLPATSVLSPTHLHCLRVAVRKLGVRIPETASIRDVLLGIARLGGHIPRNGEPGWQVLLRGQVKLMVLVEGFELAQAEM